MMRQSTTSVIRPVEQAGRLLGSIVAASQSRIRQPEKSTQAGSRAAAVQVWTKVGRRLAGSDDVEAFVCAYQDAFGSYRRAE